MESLRFGLLLLLSVAIVIILTGHVRITESFVFVNGTDANLSLWDTTEPKGGPVTAYADQNATFYANFTNITSGESINGTGVWCEIKFNISGWTTPVNMSFNSSSRIYQYNRSFPSKGNYSWNTLCDGSNQNYDVLNATDYVIINNTDPVFVGGSLPPDYANLYEDSTYNYDLDATDADDNDDLNFTDNTDLFVINADTGVIDFTPDNESVGDYTGMYAPVLIVQDTSGDVDVYVWHLTIHAVNDAPNFTNLPDSINTYQNQTFSIDLEATDEEGNVPFTFNISFVNCSKQFANFTGPNCTLFGINHSSGVINRTIPFDNLDVGNYTINFTVTDGNPSIEPYNATGWKLVDFSVINLNDPPNISFIQNQVMNQTNNFTLIVNGTDIDNDTLVFNTTTYFRNLTLCQNASLFPIVTNASFYSPGYPQNATAGIMNYTVENFMTGNYTVNFTLTDGNATVNRLVNFTVYNLNDPPNLTYIGNHTTAIDIVFYHDVNATDPDFETPYGDTHTFNVTNISGTLFFGINSTTGVLNFTPNVSDIGEHIVNISVTDSGNLTDWEIVNISVFNNTAPNITSSPGAQATSQNQDFLLIVNATDLENDNLTFRAETYFQNLTLFSKNVSLFPIETNGSYWYPENVTAGIMNYTIGNNQVGNYTVKMIVNDTWGAEDFVLVDFTVWNVNDPPNLNFSCANNTYEDSEYFCNAGENTTDIDTETPYGETLVYNLTIISGLQFFTINSTSGLINFTPSNDSWANNSYNLTYFLNITVNDSGGLVDWEEFNLTIHAVNDPPDFNFTNLTAWQNSTFFTNLSSTTSDEENDIPFYYNLTFLNCSKINASDTNCSVFVINQTTGVMNFTPVYDNIGNYSINVTVRDSGNTTTPHNSTGWEVINFTIRHVNSPPSIDLWYSDPTNRSIVENDTINFFVSISDLDGDSLTCRWYKNGVLNRTITSCEGTGGSLEYKSSFEDSGLNNGTHNFTLIVDDGNVTTWDWRDVNVTNKNRPPYLYFIVQNQTWPMNYPNTNINITYHMRDRDNENNVSDDDNNLTFSFVRSPYNMEVSIDNGTGKVTLTPATDWYGLGYIIFDVNDSEFGLSSNNVSLDVIYVETQTETVVQQTGGGGTTTETKIASLTITVLYSPQIKSNSETDVSIIFKNTGEVTLGNIVILAETPEKNDLSLSLSTDKVKSLEVNKEVTTKLTITTYELTKDSYEIRVTGSVSDPKFNQSTTIYLENLLANRTRIEEELQVVKDLFEENPECLDLTELILEAEKELGERNLERAKELTETALQNCRDLIRYSANMTQPIVPRIRETIPITEMIIVLIIISLFTIGAYYAISRRAERKIKKRRKEKEEVIIRT